jgi:cytochrome c553
MKLGSARTGDTKNTSPSSFPSLREESRSLGRHREKCARWPVWRTPVSSRLNSRVRMECPNPACEPESKTVERSPMMTTRSDCFFAIAVITSLVVSTSPAFAQQKLGAPPGQGSFVRYCGACHGDDGKGDGPKASTLNPKPADLTQLAKNSNGTFPTARVMRILDGSEAIPAHGSAQNPVWGHVFGAGEHAAGGNPEQTVARQRMQLIVRYLESIQEK